MNGKLRAGIAKQVDTDGDGTFDQAEKYVYDGDDVVFVFDDAGSLTNRYLHGPAVDQVFASEDAMNEVLWGLGDNQGTIRDVVKYDSGSTEVVNHITYDAFGNITDESDSSVEFLYAYTGRIWDEDAELYYYRARWYDPAIGRFISEDPIGFQSGNTNLYRYVGNSPVNGRDPSGLFEVTVFGETFVAPWDDDAAGFTQTVGAYGSALSNADQQFQLTTRAFGAARLTGGVAEAATGATLATGGTVGTGGSLGTGAPVTIPMMVGGAALAVHGADETAAGFQTLVTGTYHRTNTSRALDTVTGDPRTSETIEAYGSLAGDISATNRILLRNPRVCPAGVSRVSKTAPAGFNPTKLVGEQAIVSPHLPPGRYPALVVDGRVHVARFHSEAWALAGRKGVEQFYGFAEIDAAGKVVSIFK